MTNPYRPPSAALTDFATHGIGVPDWGLIAAGLALEHFLTVEIGPILHLSAGQALGVALDSLGLLFALVPFFAAMLVLLGLTLTTILQVVVIYGSWYASRTRPSLFILILGALVLLKTVGLLWLGDSARLASDFDGLELRVNFLNVPCTVVAIGVAYAWARRTANASAPARSASGNPGTPGS